MRYSILLFLFFVGLNAFCQIPEKDLAFHLPFNGAAVDVSEYESAIEVHGASLTVDRFGFFESAYHFDGIDDYIMIDPVANLEAVKDFTISLWFQHGGWHPQSGFSDNVIDQQYIFNGHAHSETISSDYLRPGANIGLFLLEDNSNFVRNTTYDPLGNTYSNNVYTENELMNNWFHHVFVRNGTKTFHYLNGVLMAEFVNEDAPLNMQHRLYLGTFSGNNPNYNNINYNFAGTIDDVRFYTLAATSDEVVSLFEEFPVTSVREHSLSNIALNIYPNPANEFLNVERINWPDTPLQLQFINGVGQVIYQKMMHQNSINIDLGSIDASGINYLLIRDKEGKLLGTEKIIFLDK